MKRYGNLFEKITDIDNIRLAHKNARKNKTKYKEIERERYPYGTGAAWNAVRV